MATELQRAAIAPNFEQMQSIAAEFLRWCVWRYEDRGPGQKPAKVPCANGRRLDTTKPDAWLPFAKARSVFNGGGFEGVGVLMTGTDGVVAFDIDNCLDSSGKVVAEQDAVAALLATGSYVEVSPSGRGLRGFVKGAKPAGAREKVGSIEVYDGSTRGRYVTVTGQLYGSGVDVVADQAAIDTFCEHFKFLPQAEGHGGVPVDGDSVAGDTEDTTWPVVSYEQVDALLTQNNKRGAITRLRKGDTTGYPGESEARAALIGHAAYYTRDIEILDRIMRASGLMKDKLDEKRNGEPFSVWEIKRVLKGLDSQRSYWSDQADKATGAALEKAAARSLAEKGRLHLVGGLDGITNGKGKIQPTIQASVEVLCRDRRTAGGVWFDAFAMMPIKTPIFAVIAGQPSSGVDTALTDRDYRQLEAWLAREWAVHLKPGDARRVMAAWADRTTRNPVTERLDEFAEQWDGAARCGELMAIYFGATPADDELMYFYSEVSIMLMVSIVARAYQPGAKVDTMVIVESSQGKQKSTGIRRLVTPLSPRAFLEGLSLGNIDKDTKIALRGRAVAEVAELEGMSRHDATTLKNFLSTTRDSYRDPYGIVAADWPRTAVLIGTTNEKSYLRDPTGNRRYWCIDVGKADLKAIDRDAAQLWGEAVRLYREGRKWWIDEDREDDRRLRGVQRREAMKRLQPDTWVDLIEEFNERLAMGQVNWVLKDSLGPVLANPANSFRLVDLMALVFADGKTARRTPQEEVRFRTALTRAGWLHNGSAARGRWRLSADALASAKERVR